MMQIMQRGTILSRHQVKQLLIKIQTRSIIHGFMDAEQASADSTEKGAKYATQLIQRRKQKRC
ncbi:hypothetical protein GBA52_019705 [Prunus armeniaca]|nr:hypothetical protein GBA52_019705 [Prunus armeniaca]